MQNRGHQQTSATSHSYPRAERQGIKKGHELPKINCAERLRSTPADREIVTKDFSQGVIALERVGRRKFFSPLSGLLWCLRLAGY